MAKCRRETYSTGIRIDSEIAKKIWKFADQDNRSFANAIEVLVERALGKMDKVEEVLTLLQQQTDAVRESKKRSPQAVN